MAKGKLREDDVTMEEPTLAKEPTLAEVLMSGKEPPPGPPGVGPLVYVGPSIPGGALRRFQVFKGELPAYVRKVIAEIPEVVMLFAPAVCLDAMRRKIETPGTNEARLFYAVQKAAMKGGKRDDL
ncbi:MAG: hypothetical protein IJR14_07135 [Synergistaceae bacterium]|nr:hypothetical protein [Synergistaceae bacterium]